MISMEQCVDINAPDDDDDDDSNVMWCSALRCTDGDDDS